MDAFEARLQALNARFTELLPGTLERIAQLRAVVGTPQAAPGAPAELHQHLHTLAGSAATFGHPALGQQARQAEQALRGLLGAPDPDWDAWFPVCDDFLDWAQKNAGRGTAA